jgi:hypothetical protein
LHVTHVQHAKSSASGSANLSGKVRQSNEGS